jgi:hypothetical protein
MYHVCMYLVTSSFVFQHGHILLTALRQTDFLHYCKMYLNKRLQFLTAASMNVWTISMVAVSIQLWNVGLLQRDYMGLYPRRM